MSIPELEVIRAIKENDPLKFFLYLSKVRDFNFTEFDSDVPMLIESVDLGNLMFTEALIRQGADVNMVLSSHVTPLIWSAQDNNLEMVKLLVTHGADINAHDGMRTSLHFCLQSRYIDMSLFLIENGADIDIPDISGETCRHLIEKHDKRELFNI